MGMVVSERGKNKNRSKTRGNKSFTTVVIFCTISNILLFFHVIFDSYKENNDKMNILQ